MERFDFFAFFSSPLFPLFLMQFKFRYSKKEHSAYQPKLNTTWLSGTNTETVTFPGTKVSNFSLNIKKRGKGTFRSKSRRMKSDIHKMTKLHLDAKLKDSLSVRLWKTHYKK